MTTWRCQCPVLVSVDDIVQDILESSGANNFFTLVRYNPPELLEDYNYFKKLEAERKKNSEEDDLRSTLTEEDETAEDIIFTLFGPRVWQHNGQDNTSVDGDVGGDDDWGGMEDDDVVDVCGDIGEDEVAGVVSDDDGEARISVCLHIR